MKFYFLFNKVLYQIFYTGHLVWRLLLLQKYLRKEEYSAMFAKMFSISKNNTLIAYLLYIYVLLTSLSKALNGLPSMLHS